MSAPTYGAPAGGLVAELVCVCGWHGEHRADALEHLGPMPGARPDHRIIPSRMPAYRLKPPPWYLGRLVGFDLETTGTDVREARIVSAAVVEAGGGLPVSTLALLADPGVEIPDEAAGVHGITTARARAEGQPAKLVVAALLDVLRTVIEERTPLVIFNAPYDLTVLHWEAVRHDLEPLDLADALVFDPIVVDRELDRYRQGSRKLDATVKHWGAVLSAPHESAADALAACRVAYRIATKGQVVRRPPRSQAEADEIQAVRDAWAACRDDLPRLVAAQRAWAWRQAVSLADHFLATAGRDTALEVRGEWPVVPAGAQPLIPTTT